MAAQLVTKKEGTEIMTAGKFVGVLGALTLAATSIAANAADASRLSLAPAATSAAAQDGEGGGGVWLAALLGVGIIAIPVLGLTVGDDDEDLPTSP